MSKRTIAIGLIVLGVLVLVVVFAAGPLHLAGTTFGPKKIIGAVVGVILLGAGIYLTFLRRPVSKI